MRKANTEHLDMHCQVLAKPHSSTHTNMPGKSCAERHQALCSTCPGKAAWQGERYVWGTRQLLLSQQCKKNTAVGTGARSVMSLEFLTHLSQVSLQGIQTKNTFRIKKMLSNHVCRIDLSNQEDKLNTMQLISVHSYSLHSELPRAPFQSTRLFAYTSTILTAVVSPTRIEEQERLESSLHFSTKHHAFS